MFDYLYLILGVVLLIVTGLFAVIVGARGAESNWSSFTWFILLTFLCVLIIASAITIAYSIDFI